MRAAAPAPAAEPFPWDEVTRVGLGVLRLSPDAFWSMTPREFAAAAGALSPRRAPPGRDALDRLMRTFPDRMKPNA